MSELATWIEQNFNSLVQAAVGELSESETLRSQVTDSVQTFFDGVLRVASEHNPTQLYVILLDWVETRSALTEEEPTGLVEVLTILKLVTWHEIQRLAPPQQAIALLMESDAIFSNALAYLAKLEADALLADMGRRLKEAQAHVSHLEKRKSDFIAVAAHELRTPLTVIEGYAEMLRSSVNNEAQVMMIDGVGGGVRRLREIIRDMIDVSMINMNLMRDKLRYQPVILVQIVEALQRQIADVLEQRRQVLVYERSSIPSYPTYADPERLMQVIEKVVMNAVKYTPDGGTITISARELQGFTDLMVEDTGIGIAPNDLQRIFDVFSSLTDVSLHSSGKTKFKGGGPGLGLAIAKGIIEAHGGTIWAQSPGYNEATCPGSTFHIMVPMRNSIPDHPK